MFCSFLTYVWLLELRAAGVNATLMLQVNILAYQAHGKPLQLWLLT